MIVKGGGSFAAGGAGPPSYVTGWYYPPQCGAMDPGTTTVVTTTTRIYYIPYFCFQTHSFTSLHAYNSGVGDSGNTVRMGVYSHHASYGPRTLLLDCSTATLTAAAAKLTCTGSTTIALTKGFWWLAIQMSGASTMYAMRSRIASGFLWRGQADFGSVVLDATGLDCVNYFPYVDTAVAAFATSAVAPTSVTSIVPKVWLKA